MKQTRRSKTRGRPTRKQFNLCTGQLRSKRRIPLWHKSYASMLRYRKRMCLYFTKTENKIGRWSSVAVYEI